MSVSTFFEFPSALSFAELRKVAGIAAEALPAAANSCTFAAVAAVFVDFLFQFGNTFCECQDLLLVSQDKIYQDIFVEGRELFLGKHYEFPRHKICRKSRVKGYR